MEDVRYDRDFRQERYEDYFLKLKIFKQSMKDFSRDAEKVGDSIREVNAKYQASKEIFELRESQRQDLEEELKANKLNLKETQVSLIGKELEGVTTENKYIAEKLSKVKNENTSLKEQLEALKRKKGKIDKEVSMKKDRLDSYEHNKLTMMAASDSAARSNEVLMLDFKEKNQKYNQLELKLRELAEETLKNEELIKFERFQNEKLVEINLALTEKITFKERDGFSYERKIEEVKDNIEETDAQSLDRQKLNENLESQISVARDLSKNNAKLNNLLSYIIESFEKKCKALEESKEKLRRAEISKGQVLNKLKEISSLKKIFDQYGS